MAFQMTLIDELENENGSWKVLGADDTAAFLEELAREYVALRTETLSSIQKVNVDGIIALDATALLERLRRACVPERMIERGNFDVTRSDFGECISYCILRDHFESCFGYKALRDRELISLPGRGIDSISVEEPTALHLPLVLGETKTSTDPKSPPRVVDCSDDCLKNQHLGHAANLPETARKVFEAARKAIDNHTAELLFAAAALLEDGRIEKLKIHAFCCLVRPSSVHKETDFGSFRTDPGIFAPFKPRFVVFCVPTEDLEAEVTRWVELAKEGGTEHD